MEGCGGGSTFDAASAAVGTASVRKKKRSSTSRRRPRPDSLPFTTTDNISSPPSDTNTNTNTNNSNVSKVSSDDNNNHTTTRTNKDFNLNQCASRGSHPSVHRFDATLDGCHSHVKSRGSSSSSERGRGGSDFTSTSDGILAPDICPLASRKNLESRNSAHSSLVSDGSGNENKLRKVKLKVGGVTRTIHPKSSSNVGASSLKLSRSSDVYRARPKLILQDNSDDEQSPPPGKTTGSQGVLWKGFSRVGSSIGKDDISTTKVPVESVSGKQTDKSETLRKSKRVPKPRVLDGAFSTGDKDGEIRYLERFKTPKFSVDHGAEDEDDEYDGGKKQRKLSSVSRSTLNVAECDEDVEYESSRFGGDGKKKYRSEKIAEDTDYVGEEELASDVESEIKRKKQKKESVDNLIEGKKEMSLTTRQRALQSGKDTPTGSGGGLIEFPNGLPPAPPRKQKEKLSELEQQLKKAEAAQRRRMQVEKAARESEAEAIRKILGQDSSRKKREDKMKKRRDEIAQEKAANAMMLPPNTIRWVIGPTGTVVTFPQEIGLPSIFSSKPCSYPPPREKCAGPSCTNAYKYRDSKSKLPLCSLQCYKALNDQMQPVSTC